MLISVFPNQHTIFVMNAYFEKIIILKNIDFFNGFETLIIFTMPFFLLFFQFMITIDQLINLLFLFIILF